MKGCPMPNGFSRCQVQLLFDKRCCGFIAGHPPGQVSLISYSADGSACALGTPSFTGAAEAG